MGINYAGGSNITANGIHPSNEPAVTKNFTVTGNNTTGSIMGYSLSLVMDENTFSIGALKYKLTSTNTGGNGEVVPAISEAKDLYIGPTTNLLGAGYFNQTSGNKVHTYKLEIYFPETGLNQNADQGKTFKAHIGISDMACIDCLKDNILAQGGGVSTISAKPTPNYGEMAPIKIYEENEPKEITSNMNPAYIMLGPGYTVNTSIGVYILEDVIETAGYTYTAEDIGKYVCDASIDFDWVNYSGCTKIYKINGVANGVITSATEYSFKIYYDTRNMGIYASDDEYGTSYYYRGAKEILKNNVIFAEQQWKIIRINGDGSTRIMYNGPCPENNCSINSTGSGVNVPYNANPIDNKYIGYMYGGSPGSVSTSRAQATTNETSSTLKTNLDKWYSEKLSGYASKIADTIYCNDRQLISEVGGSATGTGFGTSNTLYAGYQRLLVSTKAPNLKCGLKNDSFTVSDTTKGNGALTYPVGLLTADEIVLSGALWDRYNTDYYLYRNTSGNYWWSASPYHFNSTYSYVLFVYSFGHFYTGGVYGTGGLRPAVTLKSTTRITGLGTSVNPFKVV